MELKTAEDLKNAIQKLEFEQSIQKALLKEQVFILGESLKPINLFKDSIKRFYSVSLEKASSKGLIGFMTSKLIEIMVKKIN